MSEYASSQIWTNFASKTSLLLGVAQIVIGVFCIIFQTVVIIAASPSAKMVQGLWGGIFVSEILLYFNCCISLLCVFVCVHSCVHVYL